MIKNCMLMPMLGMNSESLRPRESTKKNTKKTAATIFTMPYIPQERREFVVYPTFHGHPSVQNSGSVENRPAEEMTWIA